jgi:hypothetical protein
MIDNSTQDRKSNIEENATIIDDFSEIKKNMDYDEVIKEYGPPLDDIGSGLYILIYEGRKNSSNVMLRLEFDTDSKLKRLSIMNQNNENKVIFE